ncbi:MAG: PQQ-binding-like beta-propeller repeat protein [Pirellulales bacterium]
MRAWLFVLVLSTVPCNARAADEAPADAWPMARGTLAGTGRSAMRVRFPLQEAWHRSFGKTAFEATPIVANGTIYVGDLDGTFHALSLETGEPRWTFKGSAGFPAAAALSTDPAMPLVVAGDAEGGVRAFDRGTGEVRWEHRTEGEISGGPTIMPTRDGLRVLVGSQDATLTCLDLADGMVVWTHTIADQIRCGPTVVEGIVLVAGCDGKLHLIDASTGNETAAVPIDGPTGTTPASEGGRAFFGTEGGTFHAIDIAPPREAWKAQSTAKGKSYRSSAAISGGLAIVGSRGRAIESFATDDGAQRWRHPMRGRVDASPVIVHAGGEGGREAVIVGDSAGRIVAVDAATGAPVWEFDAGGDFAGGAAVADGRVVLANGDGTIWCFTPAAP